MAIDEAIRRGERAEALRLFEMISPRSIARENWLQYASLSRRLRVPNAGIKCLQKVVRPRGNRTACATVAERAEYAACLTGLGALHEAQDLLAPLRREDYALVPLYQGFLSTIRWNYGHAAKHFRDFLAGTEQTAYEYRIASVNLAAALIFLKQYAETKEVLFHMREQTAQANERLLFANCLELSAQNEIENGNYQDALRFLELAEQEIRPSNGIETFFIRKWKGVIALKQLGPTAGSLLTMRKLKVDATRYRLWEGIRDIDYHVAVATHDTALLERLYHGTPSLPLRERYLAALEKRGIFPGSEFTLKLGTIGKLAEINLRHGDLNAKAEFKPGLVPHRLLTALVGDVYRPKRIIDLFDAVFPGEVYYPSAHPESTTDRMRQALKALRKSLHRAKLPLSIQSREGFYEVEPRADYRVELTLNSQPIDRLTSAPSREALFSFHRKNRDLAFEAKYFIATMKLPRRTGFRYLSEGVKAGWISKSGSGKQLRYRFA